MLRNLIGFGLICLVITAGALLPCFFDRRNDSRGHLHDRIKIQIMNGTPQQGAARELMYRLIHDKFDVLSLENYPRTDFPFSLVIDRKNRSSELQRLKRTTGFAQEMVLPDESIYDFTIILGKDMMVTP